MVGRKDWKGHNSLAGQIPYQTMSLDISRAGKQLRSHWLLAHSIASFLLDSIMPTFHCDILRNKFWINFYKIYNFEDKIWAKNGSIDLYFHIAFKQKQEQCSILSLKQTNSTYQSFKNGLCIECCFMYRMLANKWVHMVWLAFYLVYKLTLSSAYS